MVPNYFDALFTFSAAGLGLILAGGLNLALGSRGRRIWLRVVVTLLVCGAVVAGLAFFTRLELGLIAGGMLAGVLLVATVSGSGWLVHQITSLVFFFRKPAPRWGLVAVVGLFVVLGAGIIFEKFDAQKMDEEMHDLELLAGHPPSQPANGTHANTDRGMLIVLKEPVAPRDASELRGPEGKTLQDSRVGDQVIRRGAPTDLSNCHGWVFTGGKFLLSPDDVELILKDNGYQEVREPRSGDLAIYRQIGAITHSAIVRYVAEGLPVIVEGKWGVMGVFLHPADKSFYGTDYTFYRSARQGHILVGLGGTPASSNTLLPTATE